MSDDREVLETVLMRFEQSIPHHMRVSAPRGTGPCHRALDVIDGMENVVRRFSSLEAQKAEGANFRKLVRAAWLARRPGHLPSVQRFAFVASWRGLGPRYYRRRLHKEVRYGLEAP